MKKTILSLGLCISASILFSTATLDAQTFDNAGTYMDYITNEHRAIMQDVLGYTSAVAHGKSARKVDKRRKEMLVTIKDAKKKIAAMPPYKGDRSYRDSVVVLLEMTYIVMNEDYEKIVNMEEIAEQSYDAMEAYMKAQEVADDKLDQSQERAIQAQKEFAADNNVNLIEAKDELSKKMRQAGRVNSYYHRLYLVFFKSYKQEYYLVEALNKNDISGLEQNRNALISCSKESLAKLDTMRAFDGDISVVMAARQMMNFYLIEAKDKMPILIDFILKKENFDKVKKAFDAKPQNERTQEDVDQYNKAVNDMNAAVVEYNKNNQWINENRSKQIQNWNTSVQKFMDKVMP